MLPRLMVLVAGIMLLSACATKFNTPNARGYYASSPQQCVPYARAASGIPLYGDAHTWWYQASQRGNIPVPGSVLVLSRTPRMVHGHVAVVRNVIGPRDIFVTHSNWGHNRKTRRIIYEAVRAQDVSAANDWTSIRFWGHETKAFGTPYAAHGFIYR